MGALLKSNNMEDLVSDFRSEMARIQADFTKKTQIAQMQGDLNSIQMIASEFENQVQKLTEEMNDQKDRLIQDEPPAPKMQSIPSIYSSTSTQIDLNELVYDGDRDTLLNLLQDEGFNHLLELARKSKMQNNTTRELLKTALKLTPSMAPNIHTVGENCLKTLGLSAKLEFYVYQDPQFCAKVYYPRKGQIFIIVTSGLLENFDQDELSFVIGHELGHYLFQHHKYPAQDILQIGRGRLSPLQAMQLYAWKRNAEISADRAGLLCCKNFEVVAKTFFKLSSGITNDLLHFQLNEYIDQFKDIPTESSDLHLDPQDWYSTHPFSPLRLKALQVFKDSQTYHKFIDQPGGTLSEEDLENTIKGFMSMMEPSYLTDDTALGQEVQKFLLIGGYALALANEVVENSELNSLKQLVKPEYYNEWLPMFENKTMDNLMTVLETLAVKVNNHLSHIGKLNLVKDLSVITYADGQVDATELEVLYEICHYLEVHPEFVDRVLHDAGQ